MTRKSEKAARERLAAKSVVVHKKGGQHYDGYNDVEVYKHGLLSRVLKKPPKKVD